MTNSLYITYSWAYFVSNRAALLHFLYI